MSRSTDALRAGIIGGGRVAERHAAAYAAHPSVSLAGIAEPVRERGEAVAAAFETQWFPSAEEMLAAGIVDAVSICVPHDAHLAVARAAAAHGVHMLLEKPLATNLADGREIIGEASRADVTLMIGFVHRFRTEVLEAKRLIASGAIGTPATALDRFCSPGGEHPPPWVWQRERSGGGVLMYGGIHAVDRLRWLLSDEVTSVTARVHNYAGFGDVEDGVVALLAYSGGTTAALFENSPPYGRPGRWTTEIFGDEGAIRILTGAWVELTSASKTFRLTTADDLHFQREIAEFVDAISFGRVPSISGADGYASLEVALAVYDSAAEGSPIALDVSRASS